MRKTKLGLGLLALILSGALVISGCGNGGGGEGGGFTWHESHDVIVIGSGISGYTTFLSILQAAENAGETLDVLFIEQRPVPGGITTLAGGPNFNYMANWHGLEESVIETRYNLWMRGAGGNIPSQPAPTHALALMTDPAVYPDYDLLHPIFRAIRDAEIFLFRQFGGTHTGTGRPAVSLATQVNTFTGAGGTGVQYVQAFGLAGNALAGTGHLRLNHRATALHMAQNEDGYYVGYGITLVDNLGRTRNHRARVIVFATGSFSQNQAMKTEFGHAAGGIAATGLHHFFIHSLDWVGADGSGINILRNPNLQRPAAMHYSGFGVITGARPHHSLLEIGRELIFDGADGYSGRLLHPAFGGGTHIDSILQDEFRSVLVNSAGARTLNEYSASAWNAKGSHHMLTENLFPYWRVFRSDALPQHALQALEQGFTFAAGNSADALRVRQELARADSITDLAAALFPTPGAARTAFLATMEAYSAWVYDDTPDPLGKTAIQAGGITFRDGDTDADNDPVEFFAVRWYPTGWDTAGGVRTNYNAQVIDLQGDAIPNVFAVGGVSNRFYFGETYVGGSSLTFYPAIARRAARQIMEVLEITVDADEFSFN